LGFVLAFLLLSCTINVLVPLISHIFFYGGLSLQNFRVQFLNFYGPSI
jgi:hypothetical protein